MNILKNPIVCGIIFLLVVAAVVICILLIINNKKDDQENLQEKMFKNDLKNMNLPILKLFGSKSEKLDSNQINIIYNQNKNLVDNLYNKNTELIFKSFMNTKCIEENLIISFLKSFKVFILNSTSRDRTHPSIFKGMCVAFFAIVIYYYTYHKINSNTFNVKDFCNLVLCGPDPTKSIWTGVTEQKLIDQSNIFETTTPNNIINKNFLSRIKNALLIMDFFNKNAGFNSDNVNSQIIVPINNLINTIQNSPSYKSKCVDTLMKDKNDVDSARKIEAGVLKSIVAMYFPPLPPLPPSGSPI
jgi:hypothetical protein